MKRRASNRGSVTSTVISEAENPKKRAKVSIHPLRTGYLGPGFSLYDSVVVDGDDEENSFRLGKLLMKNVIDIKATGEELIILKKTGSVTILTLDLEGDSEACNTRDLKLPSKAIQICAGIEHAACLLDDGRVYMWGSFENPPYMFKDQFSPVTILPKEHIVQIASGRDHFLALSVTGKVFSMGSGLNGQLGRVTARSSTGEGRRGVKELLIPAKVHMHAKHIADRIWATQYGTFYRDFKTNSIFGCGENTNQEVAAVKSTDKARTTIYKPVLSQLQSMVSIGHELGLTEFGEVLARPAVEEIAEDLSKWKVVKQAKDILSIEQNHNGTFLIDAYGKAYSWTRPGNRLTPFSAHTDENLPAGVRHLQKIGKRFFFLVA